MTEAEWLACNEPEEMLQFLRDKGSERKFRLFACACCRAIWPSLEEEASQKAVVVAEAYADGLVGKKELHAARRSAGQFGWYRPGWVAAYIAVGHDAWYAGRDILEHVIRAAEPPAGWNSPSESRSFSQRLAHLLRDLFGNLFHPRLVDSSWPTWNGGVIPYLAQAIYDDRAFDQLPILADALEESGCADADLLHHFRLPGEHVRGCWAMDLLLGKGENPL